MRQEKTPTNKDAQEVQKDTADADIIKAAAKITGKPAAEITKQEAEAVLFSEIGSSERPPADKEKAMQAAADAIQEQENAGKKPQEMTLKEYLQQKYTPAQLEQAKQAAAMQKAVENGLLKLTDAQIKAMQGTDVQRLINQQQAELKNLPEYNPALDPNSALFNEAEYKQAAEINDYAEAVTRLLSALDVQGDLSKQTADTIKTLSENGLNSVSDTIETTREQIATIVHGALDALTTARDTARAIINSDTFTTLQQAFSKLTEYMKENGDKILLAAEAAQQLEELEPFIDEELKAKQQADPHFDDMSIDEFLSEMDENGNPKDSVYTQIIKAAKERKARSDAAKQTAGKAGSAKRNNAVTTIGERLSLITDQEFQNAFFTSVKADTGIFRRDTQTGERQLALNINGAFIDGIARAILTNYMNGNPNNGEAEIYIPTFAREMGLDINHRSADTDETGITRAQAREAFINRFIVEIDNIWGKLPQDNKEYKLVSVHSYNPETERLYIVSPYFQQILERLQTKETRALEAGKNYFYWKNDFLLHSTVASEKNIAAVEMVKRIIQGLQQRGNTPDSKLKQNRKKAFKDENIITYSISCAGLIEICPELREKLNRQSSKSNKTVTLQRAFKSMYRILKKKTDLYKYYKDLHIKEFSPTMSNLSAKIVITHHGENTDYNKPALPWNDAEITADAQEVQEDV